MVITARVVMQLSVKVFNEGHLSKAICQPLPVAPAVVQGLSSGAGGGGEGGAGGGVEYRVPVL